MKNISLLIFDIRNIFIYKKKKKKISVIPKFYLFHLFQKNIQRKTGLTRQMYYVSKTLRVSS